MVLILNSSLFADSVCIFAVANVQVERIECKYIVFYSLRIEWRKRLDFIDFSMSRLQIAQFTQFPFCVREHTIESHLFVRPNCR